MKKLFESLDEAALIDAASQFAQADLAGVVVYLEGDLGAGKTTFTRGVLQALGHEGAVKSPTYTLVEPYELAKVTVYHFDLYRLRDPEELEFMGIREYFSEKHLCLVEWPSCGEGHIPAADIVVSITRICADLRELQLIAQSKKGESLLAALP